ncbi:MAG TPA: AGE family epimerase/isomerase [Trueperaceae bacterium]|nr:AGE family epimerase/isomerase [Trueperaceae bacterium]
MPENRALTQGRRRELVTVYRDGLLNDTLPFWARHAVDREHGGFQFCLDRDGSVLDTDKGMWQHGRFVWLLSTLLDEVEPRDEWLDLATHGLKFIREHGFDSDGRAFFQVTRDGRPLVKRRYVFTETFHAVAFAAYAKATGDERARDEAMALFSLLRRYLATPGLLQPKVDPVARPMKGLVVPMILIATAQVLRAVAPDPTEFDAVIDECIAEIERDFVKEEFRAVLETVGPNGEFLDHFQGRTLCPGHAIEASWFILREAVHRGGDKRLIGLGTKILDWMFDWGWDEVHGGILYYRDVKNLPSSEYWHDMKFWWPHNETLIAALYAYRLTLDAKYMRLHDRVHEWAYGHFPDPEHGEWYGYLHRDGSVATRLKGNIWKGPFHLPRMQLVCWQQLQQIAL